ncbi:MAG: hypothetical protein WDZ94_00320 [Patescibacteria group bacterium]
MPRPEATPRPQDPRIDAEILKIITDHADEADPRSIEAVDQTTQLMKNGEYRHGLPPQSTETDDE